MAGETYKILDLDIDYSKLVKSTTEAKIRVSQLKEEMAQLKKENKEGTDEYVKLEAELKSASNDLRINQKIITDLTSANNAQTASVEQMRKMLSVVSAQWAQLSEEERNNTAEGQRLTDQKTKLTAQLKTLEAATGDNRRNVGNYTQSIVEAGKQMGIYGGTFGGVLNAMSDMKGRLVAVKDGFNAAGGGVSGFGKALAATGIGLIIIAIGLLVNWLSKLDPVMDKVEQVTAGFGAAINVVTKTIINFIDGIKNVGDAVSKLGNFLVHPIESLKSLGKEMAVAAKEAYNLKDAQQQLADAQSINEVATAKANQQIKELIVQSKNRSLSEKERQELLKKADKLERESFDTRMALALQEEIYQQYAIKSKARLTAEEEKLLKANGTAYANELLNKGRIYQDDYDKYKSMELAKVAILDESTQRQEKIQNQSDALAEKAKAKAEAAQKAAEEAARKKADAIQKAHEQTIKSMEDELALMEAVAGKERANENEVIKIYKQRATILQKQREYGQISEKKYQAELIKLQDEYVAESKARLAQLADARIKDFQDELAVYKLLHESKLQDGQLLTDELIAQEIERLKAIKDQDEQLQYERYEAGKISANEYLAYQLEADKQFIEQQDALYKEHKQQQDEAKAIDLANDYEIRRLQGESELSIRISQLDEAYKAEIAAAEKVGADTTKIQQKYALQQKAIEKELTNTKLKVASDFLGTFSELVGKQTAIGKAAAIAKATIDTYQAANAAYAAMAGIPVVGPALGAIAAATAVAAGIVNIRNIAKAERGGKFGTVRGNYHSSGGTKYYGEDGNVIEMEKDENFYVLNRGASRAINSLSSLNEYYGGVGFSNSVLSGHYADGGLVARQLSQDVDISSQVAKGVADGIKDFKAVVAVEDIITGVDSKVSLVDGSSI